MDISFEYNLGIAKPSYLNDCLFGYFKADHVKIYVSDKNLTEWAVLISNMH